jgi:putative spermidine/putrescine transport system permease protein
MRRIWAQIAVWGMVGALLLPLIPMAIWSFARGWRFPDLLPAEWSHRAWTYAFSDTSGVLGSIWVTIWIAASVTIIALVIGIPAGRALGLHQFRGKRAVEAVILAPLIVPPLTVALGLQGVFIGLGLTGSIWGVILVHLIPVLPYVILIMTGIFANFDPTFEAQARSLGASRAQVFTYVTLPALAPGVMVAMLMGFLISWSQYLLTLMIGGGRVVTLPLILFNFASSGRNDITGAIAVIYILPAVAILALTARRMLGFQV